MGAIAPNNTSKYAGNFLIERSVIEQEWYLTDKTGHCLKIFVFLKSRQAIQNTVVYFKKMPIELKKGQFACTNLILGNQLGLTKTQVQNAIRKLKQHGVIQTIASRLYTIFSFVNERQVEPEIELEIEQETTSALEKINRIFSQNTGENGSKIDQIIESESESPSDQAEQGIERIENRIENTPKKILRSRDLNSRKVADANFRPTPEENPTPEEKPNTGASCQAPSEREKSGSAGPRQKPKPVAPFDDIVDMLTSQLPIPKVYKITPERKKQIRQTHKEIFNGRLDEWQQYILYVTANCQWLLKASRGHRAKTIDFFINIENACKIREGSFDNFATR